MPLEGHLAFQRGKPSEAKMGIPASQWVMVSKRRKYPIPPNHRREQETISNSRISKGRGRRTFMAATLGWADGQVAVWPFALPCPWSGAYLVVLFARVFLFLSPWVVVIQHAFEGVLLRQWRFLQHGYPFMPGDFQPRYIGLPFGYCGNAAIQRIVG